MSAAKARRCLLLATGLLFAGACAEETPPWNVVVLVPDTVRGDHVSVNGYERPTTPALESLAGGGANFSRAFTVAPRTWQSFSSILTGLYPPHHGVRFIFDDPIAPGTPTLASLLAAHGWETAAFDTDPFLEGMTGARGFAAYHRPERKQRAVHVDEETLRIATGWVLRERTAPFLAFVRLSGAHWPYVAAGPEVFGQRCSEFDHAFNQGTYGIALGTDGKGTRLRDAAAFRRLIWTPETDPRQRDHVIAHYDARIAATDALVGRFVGRLEAAGLLERTLVVVTSDHGEAFGEHGYLQHGPRVDDAVMHVPLVIRLPAGHPAASPGRRVDRLVRTVDILPTVLDAVGIAPPAGLDGISLLPAIRGEPLPALWAYGETGRSFMGVDPERAFPGVRGKHRMIRTDAWKLVHRPLPDGEDLRLYDLVRDPGERVDVAARHPVEVERLRAHLQSVFDTELSEGADAPLAPGELEQLRELGYVQ